jgi:hypothetical protein
MVWPLLQGGDCRRVHGCSVANGGDGFQCHVAPCDGPLIVLLQHQGSDQAGDGGFVWKDADDVGPPLDFLVSSGFDLRPVFPGKSLVGEHVVLGAAHQVSELWMAWREGVDQLGPVTFRSCKRVLIKGCSGAAVTIGRSFLPTQASAFLMKWTRQRWTVAPSTLAAAAFSPL